MRWWESELDERSGAGVDTGPPLLLIIAPLLASVSRKETNNSEKL